MPTTPKFVITSEDYAVLCARASSVFHLDRSGLPEQVFQDGFANFRFVEFDLMLFREFWSLLAACAEVSGDKDVSIIVHEPTPESYYYANFKRYGALRFDRSSSAADYKEAFLVEPEDSPADALQYVSRVISWCGSSQEWGFWGERDLGVGVAATRRPDMSWPSIEGIKWFDVDDALSGLIATNFRNQVVPAEFTAKLTQVRQSEKEIGFFTEVMTAVH